MPAAHISPTEEIVEEAKSGRMFILLDDEGRENEGDVVMAAQFVTPQHINFMITHCRGLVCAPLASGKARRIGLTMMVAENNSKHQTPFTVSVGARHGVGTGISAFDRAKTIQTLASAGCVAEDISSPGHVFPLIAKDEGVFAREGHTEASVDIMKLAGLEPVAVICEVLNEDGTMARLPDLAVFAAKHGLKIGTVAGLVRYRAMKERPLVREREVGLFGGRLMVYRDFAGGEHFVFVKGEPSGAFLTVRFGVVGAVEAPLCAEFEGVQDVICMFFDGAVLRDEDYFCIRKILVDLGVRDVAGISEFGGFGGSASGLKIEKLRDL